MSSYRVHQLALYRGFRFYYSKTVLLRLSRLVIVIQSISLCDQTVLNLRTGPYVSAFPHFCA